MNGSMMHNIGAYIADAEECAQDAAVITAGAGNDGVAVNGNVIDRLKAGRTLSQSCKLVTQYKAVLGAGNTLTITSALKTSDSGDMSTNLTVLDTYGPTVVATGPGGGGTVRGKVEQDVDLGSAYEYLRSTLTADLSAANTDTVAIAQMLVFGPGDELPAV